MHCELTVHVDLVKSDVFVKEMQYLGSAKFTKCGNEIHINQKTDVAIFVRASSSDMFHRKNSLKYQKTYIQNIIWNVSFRRR